MPAKAGIQVCLWLDFLKFAWIPACAGMTNKRIHFLIDGLGILCDEPSAVGQMNAALQCDVEFVPENRIGFWFLGTETWANHVLKAALNDLERLIPERKSSYPVVLDVGCGQGKSFQLLIEHFSPERLIGVDAEEKCLRRARLGASRESIPIELHHCDIAALDMADASVDLVFCHQTFHHLTRQKMALEQINRVLRPGGLFLFAESTRPISIPGSFAYCFAIRCICSAVPPSTWR